MTYKTFKATETFWKAFHKLSPFQRMSAEAALDAFKRNPFDRSLNTHKIEKLSARIGRTVYSVTIDGDLRAVFFIRDDTVVTFDIGTHDIYK